MTDKPSGSQQPGPGPSTIATLLVGWFLYPVGDLIGQLIMGHVSIARLVAVALVGGLLYRFEVPAWFRFIDGIRVTRTNGPLRLFARSDQKPAPLNWVGRMLMAMLYFNPLWIARHLFIIMVVTAPSFGAIAWGSTLAAALSLGLASFVTNLPISLIGNYIVQQRLSPQNRFIGSATLSGVMVIKYAIEYRLFH